MFNLLRPLLTGLLLITLNLTSVLANSPVSKIEVPFDGATEPKTDTLLSQGLTSLIIKLTGNPTVIQQQAVQEIINKPNDFLENYNQLSQPDRLVITFDQQAIQQALNKIGIATWGDKKPTLMLWWLTHQADSNELMSDSQANKNILEQAAANQGFPIRLPIADLDEQSLADKASFTAEKPSALFTASSKYNTNAIIAVYATSIADNKWQLTWRLWQANTTELLANGQLEATSLAEASQQLFTAITPALAKIYVIKAGEAKQLIVTIKEVDFASYVQISKLMSSFNAHPLENTGSTVRYEVQADPLQLKAQLELINQYQQPSDPNSTNLIFKPQ